MALIGVHVERPVRPGALVCGDGVIMVLHFTCQFALDWVGDLLIPYGLLLRNLASDGLQCSTDLVSNWCSK